MRVGVDVGPFWASTDGCRHTHRHRHGPLWTFMFAVFLLAGAGLVSIHSLVWVIWAIPVLAVIGAIGRWAVHAAVRRAPARAAGQAAQPAGQPRNERLHYSDRR